MKQLNSQKSRRIFAIGFAVLFSALALNSCKDEPAPAPEPPDVEEPAQALLALHTRNTEWVDENNNPVLLKGTNLGNWLLQEFWMMGQSTDAVNDQCTLEAIFDERFGFDERERLMDVFRDNWITERDWDLLASFNLNVIRLPFIWNLIEDERNPMTLRADAWQYLDDAIDQAEARDMYVILDLHGAVGAQGEEHHSGCAGLNEYWDNEDYQARTRWLWQQIAARYKDRNAVAAYGLLNEPWGTTPENLAAESVELYHAVRAVDDKKIIVLPGHSAGIDAYESPADIGLTNVAFEMHFYPGIFGWGEIGYAVHRDWFSCGVDGLSGVCDWQAKLADKNAPFLVGEFQPWTGLGPELGADIARATYDRYGDMGWASTSWAYKVLTNGGGEGQGTWGMVTNEEVLGLLAKADTWACAGWDSSLTEGCSAGRETFKTDRHGEHTYYLVIKFGSCCGGNLDVSLDELSIKNVVSDEEMVVNGQFNSSAGWTEYFQNALPTLEFNATDAALAPTNHQGGFLHLTGAADINGGVYQAITLDSDATYELSGVFKDNGSTNAWAEIYLVSSLPQNGVDVLAEGPLAPVDFHAASKDDIEALFTAFGSIPYDIHETLQAALASPSRSSLFNLPLAPANLALTEGVDAVTLQWDASASDNVTGYNVYRSTMLASGYERIAEDLDALTLTDTDTNPALTYYYQVHAVTERDESVRSNRVWTELKSIEVPGRVEAEDMSSMSGIQIETTSDVGGGSNVGYMDPGDFMEYYINVASTGAVTIDYRVASSGGSDGFELLLDGVVIDTQIIPDTAGWQNWQTVSGTVSLPEGLHTLRVDVIGGGWNFNWMEFKEP
ncbi:cellulase family glycosylhydrolase [Reinekea sp. G2M2-21]|uniref:cellulase family glycosylhydrolase n=1 Tax=Reinekea sp. G2M2-21 TaxID=2788942 RepID=UPI0018A98109|nr:carbohydrate-binding protein [Reinekea sp. G2M2-21]